MKRLLWAAILTAAAAGAWMLWSLPQRPGGEGASVTGAPAAAPSTNAVACLGRFEPELGVIKVAAPYYQSRPSIVTSLLVREGDVVRQGQAIAVLDGQAQTLADREHALAAVELSRRRIAQVQAGAKPGEIEAQRSEIERLSASLRLDQQQLQRAEALAQTRDISTADLELRRAAVETSRRALESAQHRLAALSEVREPDVTVAEHELKVAETQLAQIETLLASLTVHAPASGRVIKVHTHSGEEASPEGIVEIADTTHMNVEAEVYTTDLAAVRPGQQVEIEPEGGGRKLTGVVSRIGQRVEKVSVMPNDPVAYSDSRVVPVWIRVDGCGDAPCPIHGRAKVVIGTAR
jgi:HlyD family secretion protein